VAIRDGSEVEARVDQLSDAGDVRVIVPPPSDPTPSALIGRRVALEPLRGQDGEGVASFTRSGGETNMVIEATGLRPDTVYEVWFNNSESDAVSIGAQRTDAEGRFRGAGPVPEDFENYLFIDISREPINDDMQHSGELVLRGEIGA
jgi:hypothetical protein